MGRLISIDLNRELPFNIGHWSVTNWPNDSKIKVIMNDDIGNYGATSFSINGKIQKIEFDYIKETEPNYDIFTVLEDGSQKYSSYGQGNNTLIHVALDFDDTEKEITFKYKKDGSNSTGIDSVGITNFKIQTVDDSIIQAEVKYAIVGKDNAVYSFTDDNNLTKIANSLDEMTRELWLRCSNTSSIFNVRNDVTGASPIGLKFIDDKSFKFSNISTNVILKPSIIETTNDFEFSEDYIKGIKSFEVSYTAKEGDVILIVFSTDSGTTWISYKDNIWQTLPSLDVENISKFGMTPTEVTSMSLEVLKELYKTKKLKLAFILKPVSINSEIKLKNIKCNFIL